MKFSKNYAKLECNAFTTIRKNTGYYKVGEIIVAETPKGKFYVRIMEALPIRKKDITEDLANCDADCTRDDLIRLLEVWYGKDYDDFILLYLEKVGKEAK